MRTPDNLRSSQTAHHEMRTEHITECMLPNKSLLCQVLLLYPQNRGRSKVTGETILAVRFKDLTLPVDRVRPGRIRELHFLQ